MNLDQVSYKSTDWLDVEREFYFDWMALIDNPVATLDNAIAHLSPGYGGNENAAVNTLRDALCELLCER